MATKLFSVLICCLLLCMSAAARLGPACHGALAAFSFPDLSSHLRSLTLLDHGRSYLHISGSQPRTAAAFFYSRPIPFLHPFHSPRSLSFSSSFSFSSLGAQDGDGLAFLIAPRKDFDARVQDPTGNRLGLDIELVTANVSDSLSFDDGGRLFAWIDYRAPMKVVEVRLSKFQSQRPEIPVVSYSADLSNFWSKEMFVGFSSSTGNAPQKHIIYSWSFATSDSRMRPGFLPSLPTWLGSGGRPGHSEWHRHRRPGSTNGQQHPLPELHFEPFTFDDSWLQSMSDAWRIVIAMLFGATCGVAASIFVVWCFGRGCGIPAYEDDDFGMLYGYQQLASPDSEVKVDANGYQKLPTKETESNTDSI